MQIDEELTLKKLETFLVFMRSGNLSRAAAELNTSNVSVHRAIHSLERGVQSVGTGGQDGAGNARKLDAPASDAGSTIFLTETESLSANQVERPFTCILQVCLRLCRGTGDDDLGIVGAQVASERTS